MGWFITALVFVGYLLAFILCMAAVAGGVYLAYTSYKSRRQINDEATLEHPKSGWKIHFKGAGGVLLAITGTVGCCIIVYHYWQVLLGVLIILAGGGETTRSHIKRKRVKKRKSKKKVAKKRYV